MLISSVLGNRQNILHLKVKVLVSYRMNALPTSLLLHVGILQFYLSGTNTHAL